MLPDQVLAHVVVDPEGWKAHARIFAAKQWDRDKAHLDQLIVEAALAGDDPLGPELTRKVAALRQRVDAGPDLYFAEFLNAKVARHHDAADAAAAQPGYMTRAQREAEAQAQREAEAAAHEQIRVEAEAQRQAAFDAAVTAKVNELLTERGIPAPETQR